SGRHCALLSFPTRRSSDLDTTEDASHANRAATAVDHDGGAIHGAGEHANPAREFRRLEEGERSGRDLVHARVGFQTNPVRLLFRSEEHTSELQSLAYLVCR